MPDSYPSKLTQFLYERYKFFSGDAGKGLIILPVELIENNGVKLKKYVLELCKIWKLPSEFITWINDACVFCSTLVDRIVTGYPYDEAEKICESLGYTDNLLDVAEPFGLWVIESKKNISKDFPLDKAELPVIFTDNQNPYRERKVRILNGAHTSLVLLAWLAGDETVMECMNDDLIRLFIEKCVNEGIKPFIALPENDINIFVKTVFERFENPFIKHKVLDISLNSVSKWKVRVLPSFKDYYAEKGIIAPALTFSFAALLAFYSSSEFDGTALKAKRADGTYYLIRGDESALKFFAENSGKETGEYVRLAAENTDFWSKNLSLYNGFTESVVKYLTAIHNDARTAVSLFLKGEL